MSIDYRTFIGRGYELVDAHFEDFSEDGGLEEYLEKHLSEDLIGDAEDCFLYVDNWSDTRPHFLGYSAGTSIYPGEVLSFEEIAQGEINPKKEALISQLARDLFGITDPPDWCIVSEVF